MPVIRAEVAFTCSIPSRQQSGHIQIPCMSPSHRVVASGARMPPHVILRAEGRASFQSTE